MTQNGIHDHTEGSTTARRFIRNGGQLRFWFWARLQNCENRLLVSSFLSLFVRPHETTLFPLDGFL